MSGPVLIPPKPGAEGQHLTAPQKAVAHEAGSHHLQVWVRVLLAVAVLLIWLFLFWEVNAPLTKTVEIGPGQAGTTVELQQGDRLEVSLAGNPTTGFTWEVAALDTNILKLSGSPQFRPLSNAGGAGGTVILRFETVGTGKTVLQLVYHRPSEKDRLPLNTYEVTVAVGK